MLSSEEQLVRTFVRYHDDADKQSRAYHEVYIATNYRLPLRKPCVLTEKSERIARVKREWSEVIMNNLKLVIRLSVYSQHFVSEQNDKMWKQSLQNQQSSTKCKATRSSITGSYSYTDINSNQSISIDEYKERYFNYVKSLKSSNQSVSATKLDSYERTCSGKLTEANRSSSIGEWRSQENKENITSRRCLTHPVAHPLPQSSNKQLIRQLSDSGIIYGPSCLKRKSSETSQSNLDDSNNTITKTARTSDNIINSICDKTESTSTSASSHDENDIMPTQ